MVLKVSCTAAAIREAHSLKVSQASTTRRVMAVQGQKGTYNCSWMPFYAKFSCRHYSLVSLLCFCQLLHSHHSAAVFFLAFQDVVWDAADQLAGELHGHGDFQTEQQRYSTVPGRKHLFLSSWSPTIHFPYICAPTKKMWVLLHEIVRLQRFPCLTLSWIFPKLTFLQNQSYS